MDIHIHAGMSTEIATAIDRRPYRRRVFFQRGRNRCRSAPLIVDESEDRLAWVRSKSFVLSPGAPIPIVTWTNDDWMIRIRLHAAWPFLSDCLQQSGLTARESRRPKPASDDGCSQPDHSAGTGLGQGLLLTGASDHQSAALHSPGYDIAGVSRKSRISSRRCSCARTAHGKRQSCSAKPHISESRPSAAKAGAGD